MSEGELLRNQIAQTIEETPMVLVDDWNPPRHDSFDLADAILARFDVRLREPQEETFAVNRDEALYLVSWATAVKDAYPHGFADVDHALLARLQEFWQPTREPQAEETPTNQASPYHPHDAEPVLDDEGRCLICAALLAHCRKHVYFIATCDRCRGARGSALARSAGVMSRPRVPQEEETP